MRRFACFLRVRSMRLKERRHIAEHPKRPPRVLQAAVSMPGSTTVWWSFFLCSIVAAAVIVPKDLKRLSDPAKFKKFKLTAKEPVSSTASIFTMRRLLPQQRRELYDDSHLNSIISVEIKQPFLQIARHYTPLPARQDAEGPLVKMRFLIREETQGEVSGYLHRLPVNQPSRDSLVEIRGPHVEYEIPGDVSEVLFLAGGTGIAPAMQVASILRQPHRKNLATIQILWANRRREDCVGIGNRAFKNAIFKELGLLQQSDGLAEQSAVNVNCFVDEEGSFIDERIIRKYVEQSFSNARDGLLGKKLIIISGSDGFVKYLAGSTRREGWQARPEKPVGGVLSKINLENWDVVKL